MKKILIFLMLFLLVLSTVNAELYPCDSRYGKAQIEAHKELLMDFGAKTCTIERLEFYSVVDSEGGIGKVEKSEFDDGPKFFQDEFHNVQESEDLCRVNCIGQNQEELNRIPEGKKVTMFLTTFMKFLKTETPQTPSTTFSITDIPKTTNNSKINEYNYNYKVEGNLSQLPQIENPQVQKKTFSITDIPGIGNPFSGLGNKISGWFSNLRWNT